MRRLNISIQYIPGHRNKMIDRLSRILFYEPEYSETSIVVKIKQKLETKNFK